MKEWIASFAIQGSGYAVIKAETRDEAMKKFQDGDFSEDAKIDEWDFNTNYHSGGYVEIEEG